MIERPKTPHNTSQYLSNNTSLTRPEKAMINDFNFFISEENDELMHQTSSNLDNFCVAGGSMKEIMKKQSSSDDQLDQKISLDYKPVNFLTEKQEILIELPGANEHKNNKLVDLENKIIEKDRYIEYLKTLLNNNQIGNSFSHTILEER